MLKTKKLLICILALILLCSCSPATTPSDAGTGTPDPSLVPTEEATQNRIIEATDTSPVDEDTWSLLDEYPDAIKIDGMPFSVKLYVNAPVDDEGNIAYDDGQEWALIVTDGTKYYTLIDKRIQLGEINFEVSDYYTESKAIQGITSIESTSAGFILARYELDGDVFTERIIYDAANDSDAGINRRYSSLMN